MNTVASEKYIKDHISFDERPRVKRGLFLTGTLYPHITGGMEIFNYYFLKHRFTDPKYNDWYISDKPLNGFQSRNFRVYNLWPLTLFYPFQHIWYFISKRKKYDFVNISFAEQSIFISFVQAIFLTLLRKPYFVTIFWGHIPVWRWMWPIRFFFNNAKCTIAVSEELFERYSRMFPDAPFEFIPPLVPYTSSSKLKASIRASYAIAPDDFLIIFCGTLKKMKNPDVIIKAAQVIGKDYLSANKIKFRFLGQGPLMDELRLFVEQDQLEDHIQFIGSVEEEVKHEYYNMADAYIISSDYEGNSLSLLEAMFNALPVLASDVPGINSILQNKHTAFLFQNRDETDLARCIIECFENKAFSTSLGENARKEYAKMFSFEQMVKKYDQIFQM